MSEKEGIIEAAQAAVDNPFDDKMSGVGSSSRRRRGGSRARGTISEQSLNQLRS
jgi:hypothetical protein